MTLAEQWKLEGFEIGFKIGFKLGFEKGFKLGFEKGILMIATNFIKSGLSLEFIHEQTGISIERLRQLHQEALHA